MELKSTPLKEKFIDSNQKTKIQKMKSDIEVIHESIEIKAKELDQMELDRGKPKLFDGHAPL